MRRQQLGLARSNRRREHQLFYLRLIYGFEFTWRADLMRKAIAKRLLRAELLPGHPQAPERAQAHGANEHRRRRWSRRKAEARLGNRKYRIRRRNQDVAAGGQRQRAACAHSAHNSHRRLGCRIHHLADVEDGWHRRRVLALLRMPFHIGTGREMLARPAKNNRTDLRIGAECPAVMRNAVKHILVVGVAAFGEVEGEGGDAAGIDGEQKFGCHGKSRWFLWQRDYDCKATKGWAGTALRSHVTNPAR